MPVRKAKRKTWQAKAMSRVVAVVVAAAIVTVVIVMAKARTTKQAKAVRAPMASKATPSTMVRKSQPLQHRQQPWPQQPQLTLLLPPNKRRNQLPSLSR